LSTADKHRNILDFTLSSLWRRKGKNVALVLAYTFVVFTLASVVFFTQSIKEEASSVLREAPEVIVQRLVAGRHDLIPVRYLETLREVRGVQSAKGRLWGYYYDPSNGANYTLMGVDDFRYGQGSVIVGKGVERNLLSTTGGTMPFRAHDGSYLFFKIREVLSSDSELVSSDLVLVSEEDFRKMFGIPAGYVTDIVLHVRNVKEASTVAGKIAQLLPDTRPITREEILRTYDAVFDWRGGMIVANLFGALAAFLLLAWDKATGLSAEEKREIGILKALGWETSDVLLLKFWEGVVISLSSFLMGVLLAYAHVFFTSATVFEPALKGWSVLYPEFRLRPAVSAYHAGVLFFLTVIPYTVATIIPSWRAATIDPDAVMRS
jgi:ABC-type lipoprotein release transport system permease subunit